MCARSLTSLSSLRLCLLLSLRLDTCLSDGLTLAQVCVELSQARLKLRSALSPPPAQPRGRAQAHSAQASASRACVSVYGTTTVQSRRSRVESQSARSVGQCQQSHMDLSPSHTRPGPPGWGWGCADPPCAVARAGHSVTQTHAFTSGDTPHEMEIYRERGYRVTLTKLCTRPTYGHRHKD